MEFMQGRARCCEEEEIIGNMGKLPFNSSSSCSSSPSSSHQFQAIFPPPPHHHQLISQPWGAQTCDKINSSTTSSSTQLQPWPSEPDQAAESSCDPADPTNFNGCCDPLQRKPELGGTRLESDNGDGGGGNGSSSRTDHPSICIEREHMFDKVVTPSDVGKLNRLVIPKQHAEKYFPLDSTTNEKGLLLNFEDRNGKPWRFRYSYWNSSQSYVMTKGWSRFVKEKKLYAGDIVSFERGAGELGKDRLYINWRRRPDRVALPPLHQIPLPQSVPFGQIFLPSSTVPVSMPRDQYVHHRVPQELNYEHQYLHHHHHHHHHGTTYGYNVMNPGSSAGSVLYLRSSSSSSTTTSTTPYHHQGSTDQDQMPIVFESVPVVHGKAAAVKRLRLFGVNVECPISEDEVLSSTTFVPHTTMASSSLIISPHHRHHHHQISSSSSSSLSYHPLQLRLYNGGPVVPAAATVPSELPRNNIRAQPSMSLDLDI